MATKKIRLCASITFPTAPTIRLSKTGPTGFDVSLTAGRYWADPIYGTSKTAAIGLWNALLAAIDVADTTHTYTIDVFSSANVPTGVPDPGVPDHRFAWLYGASISANQAAFLGSHANNNTEGKRLLDSLGINSVGDSLYYSQWFNGPYPAWSPSQGEAEDIDESQQGFAVSTETEDGTVYTADLGDPLQRRTITLSGLPAYMVRQRQAYQRVTEEDYGDGSFESCIWPLIGKGELFRFWGDENATLNTFTTTAMTRTSNTVTVASVTGLIDLTGYPPVQSICIDGEWMIVDTITGSVLTVRRNRPVSHPAYAPVSTDFVGTYALSPSGGNVNLGGFGPKRRGSKDDRWDMQISCVRAAW